MENEIAGTAVRFTWKNIALFIITLAILLACLLMLRPFTPAIVGAIVLAVVTRRPHRWLRRKIGNPTITSSVALVLATLSIIVPCLFLAQIVGQYAMTAARTVQNGGVEQGVNAFLVQYPQLYSTLQHSSEVLSLSQSAQKTAEFLAGSLVTVLSSSVAALMQTIIMLFILFFLYRDEEIVVRFLYRLFPLAESETHCLLERINETVRATFLGRFVAAAIQGLVAGVVFAALGIHDAAILGVLTTTVAIVPYFGAYVIWVPVAIYFAMTGHWFRMAILIAAGSLVISTLDNFLYPVLVGAQLRQHTVSIFLSLLGGIWLFGISGLVLGPVIFSVAESLLAIWSHRLQGTMFAAQEND
ncbi:MAG: AI-2E family transporter [Acidobacteriaceae bacterium]